MYCIYYCYSLYVQIYGVMVFCAFKNFLAFVGFPPFLPLSVSLSLCFFLSCILWVILKHFIPFPLLYFYFWYMLNKYLANDTVAQ